MAGGNSCVLDFFYSFRKSAGGPVVEQTVEQPKRGNDRLVMNGATRLTLGPWDKRDVHIERGQVLLRLDDAKDGVEVFSGDLQLVDIGTVFEVSRDGNRTRVLVSAGRNGRRHAVVKSPRASDS